ncbi:MAG: pitrilysin family protein [Alphaproteobacteria bacterium]
MTIEVTTLASGLRVVTDPVDTVETASVGVWINVGARHERKEVNGVAHLLEHMAFKGTERRSAKTIAEEIESVGGHLNACTSREYTAYFARVLKDDLPLAVDILADILQHSTFDLKELERERAVIIQEIGQAYDTPDDFVFDRFQEIAYPGQSLGRPILGSAERIGAMSREVIAGYMRENYSAPKMVLAAAGRVDHDAFVKLAQEAFRDLPRTRGCESEPARYRGGEAYEERELEQVHLVLGFAGVPYKDPDFYGLSVLSSLLGGGMSSRLFQEIREKRGLAYSIYSFTAPYVDGGLFGVYAGTGEGEVEELLSVTCEEIRNIGATVREEELARVKAQLKAGILMALESTSARCERLGQHMLVYGRPLSVEEMVERIEAVDIQAVGRVADRLTASRPTFAALGPIGRFKAMGAVEERFA